MEQPTILIVSDDAEFSHAIAARWQTEREVPAFTLMSGDLCRDLDWSTFDMAVAGALRPEVQATVLKSLAPAPKPALVVCQTAQCAQAARAIHPGLLVLRQHEGWLDALVLVTAEVLRRSDAVMRAQRAEKAAATLEVQAALGRYMLEMRHNLNNALTSVLGNAELLLLDNTLADGVTSQLETVRNMALRMHEILQRFSSLEKELTVVERQSERDGRMKSRAAAL